MARRAPRDPGSPETAAGSAGRDQIEDSVNAGLPAAARSVESSGGRPGGGLRADVDVAAEVGAEDGEAGDVLLRALDDGVDRLIMVGLHAQHRARDSQS